MINHSEAKFTSMLPASTLPKKITIEYLRSRVVAGTHVDDETIDALCWLAVRPLRSERRAKAARTLVSNFAATRGETIARSVAALEHTLFAHNVRRDAARQLRRPETELTRALESVIRSAVIVYVNKLVTDVFADESIREKVMYNHNEPIGNTGVRWFENIVSDFVHGDCLGI